MSSINPPNKRTPLAEEWSREYSAASSVNAPAKLAGSIMHGMWSGRGLAMRLFWRNIAGSYRQTFLGLIWIVLPTIAQVLTWSFLASQDLLKSEQLPGVPFVLFIAVGSLLWQTFFDAVQAPLGVVSSNQGLITRMNFPRESLVLVSVIQVLFDFTVRCAFVALMCLYFGVTWSWLTLLVPLLVIGLIAVGLSIGLFLTPLGVLYKDVGRTLTVISPFWMILTPVIYLAPKSQWYSVWNVLNPPAGLLSAARDLLLVGSTDALFIAATWLGISAVLLCGGLVWYRLGFPIFIERMAN